MRIAAIALSLVIAAGGRAWAADMAAPEAASLSDVKQTQETAQRELDTLRKLAREKPQSFGFESPQELSEAAVGDPLAVFLVPLDKLRQFRASDPVDPLLIYAQQIRFTVSVKQEARSSIVVEKVKGNWVANSFGEADLAKHIAKARGEAEGFLVRVPALNLYFVAHRTQGQLQFTPVYDVPDLDLKSDHTLPAAEALQLVVPAALRYNGLPM